MTEQPYDRPQAVALDCERPACVKSPAESLHARREDCVRQDIGLAFLRTECSLILRIEAVLLCGLDAIAKDRIRVVKVVRLEPSLPILL